MRMEGGAAKIEHSRFRVARNLLLFWTLYVGLGAVAGAVGMLADPSGKAMGMDAMLPCFQKLPFADVLFSDLLFSGIALLIVNGITNLTAAGLLLAKKRAGIFLGGLFGVTLMLWILIQFYMFPLNFMSTAYFIFGFLQAATGYAAWMFDAQERFCSHPDPKAYPNIGNDPTRLVVYFSRMGYVRKAALEAADRTGAVVYEIKAKERTEGTLGFWWCGRYGMHRWPMPIEEVRVDLSSYAHVTICSPIWVFALSGPVRAFCQAAHGKIRAAEYILVHHTHGIYRNAAAEMDTLLGAKGNALTTICCRRGRFISEKKY